MTQEKVEKLTFTAKDADTIEQIVRNQPLQNLVAAEQLQALLARYRAFVKAKL
jgi:hypothetical protein